MRSLIRFLNNGTLPFIGREADREAILTFCREAGGEGGLRSLVVSAAAGMGKTRLLDEVIDRLGDHELALRIRLYADSSLALAPMIGEALQRSGRKIGLPADDPGLGPIIRELRNAARLRPVILMIEDLHLLSGEPIGDLLRLLEGVAEEPISVIVTTRPGEHASLDLFQRWPREEILLEGVDREALDQLWEELFDVPGNPELLDILLRQTLGTPLALRNALASTLRSGAYAFNEEKGEWGLTIPVERFEENLQGDISRLLRGITPFLTESERRAAGLIAGLGETVAGPVARDVLGPHGALLDSLVHKRILIPAPSVQAITGETALGEEFLGFTHTLLHHNLAGENLLGMPEIIRILAEGSPLSSTLPFQRILDSGRDDRVDVAHVRSAVERVLDEALRLDRTADWGLAPTLLEAAAHLFEIYPEAWGRVDPDEEPPLEWRRGQLDLISARLRINRREDHTSEYLGVIREMSRLVEGDDLPEELLGYRLSSAAYRYQALRREQGGEGYGELFDEVEHLVGAHPLLCNSTRYIDFLEIVGRSTTIPADAAMVSRVQGALDHLLKNERIDATIRNEGLRRVAPLVLWVFYGPEELEERLRLLSQLEELVGDEIMFQTRKMAFLDGIGWSTRAWAIAERLLPRLRSQGLRRDLIQTRLYRLYASLGLGMDYAGVEQELREIEAEAPRKILPAMHRSLGVRLSQLLLARGMEQQATTIISCYLGGSRRLLTPMDRLLLAETTDDLSHVLGEDRPYFDREIGVFITKAAAGEEVSLPKVRREFEDHISSPFLMRNDLLDVYGLIRMVEARPELENDEKVRSAIRRLLRKALEWLSERGLFSFMELILQRHRTYLLKKEAEEWSEKAAEAGRSWRAGRSRPEERRLTISMLGEIALRRGGGDPVRVRGGRLRTLLGLLAAEPLLRAPLSVEEFRYIASGREEDPERARKTTAMGLLRLRELLGEDAIDQEGEVPRLNRKRAEFDVQVAIGLLQSARGNAEKGELLRGVTECRRALETLGGEVPFPTLYDDFFEAARGELDLLLRSTLFEVIDRLEEVDESSTAGELLAVACEVLPGDDEIRERYRELLRMTGRLAEAERIGLVIGYPAGSG